MNTVLRFFVIAGSVAAMLLGVAVWAGDAPPPTTPQAASRHKMEQDKEVHQWIALQAYEYYKAKLPTKTVGVAPAPEMGPPYIGTVSTSLQNDDNNVLEGTADEDRYFRNPFWRDAGYWEFPFVEHFCGGADGDELRDGLWIIGTIVHPLTMVALPPGHYQSALTRAEKYWTGSYALSSTLGTSYYYLGHVAHLLTDMTVPAHVHKDKHWPEFTAGADAYEDYVAVNKRFEQWTAASVGNWVTEGPKDGSITLPTTLEALFRETADYAEDYASGPKDTVLFPVSIQGADGEGTQDSGRHKPTQVIRGDGINDTECECLANDLMPFAIVQIAKLYRFYYWEMDLTEPTVNSLTYGGSPLSTNPAQPTMVGSASGQLVVDAQDLQSGVDINDSDWKIEVSSDGASWSSVTTQVGVPTTYQFSGANDRYYKIRVTVRNGGGRPASKTFYMRTPNTPNTNPTLSSAKVTPTFGTTSTNFEYTVVYSDADGDSPVTRNLFVDGNGPYTMTLKSGSAANGTYTCTRTAPLGNHNFYMEFRDGRNGQAITPIYSGPFVGAGQIGIHTDFSLHSADVYLRFKTGATEAEAKSSPPTYRCSEMPLVVWVTPGTWIYWESCAESTNHLATGWTFRDGNGNYLSPDQDTNQAQACFAVVAGTNIFATGHWNYTPQNYTISGTALLKAGGTVPGGVDLTLTSSEQSLTQHTNDGNWSFSNVKGGVSVTVTPRATSGGYNFSPSQLIFENLRANQAGQAIVAYQADDFVPMTTLTSVPPVVSTNSGVSFVWSGSDNVTAPANLVYEWKLDGVDAGWPGTWSSATSKSYDLPNGVYTFNVRAKDQAGNINQDPATHRFVVNAGPRVSATVRTGRSIWASQVTLEMPAGATQPTAKFVLLSEHSAMNEADLVPVAIYQGDAAAPCGANEIAAVKLGVTATIVKAAPGWVVTLPVAVPAGQTAQYHVVWGKIAYFGWKEFVSVPTGFPNLVLTNPAYTEHGGIETPYLDANLTLWRVGEKFRRYGGAGDDISFVFMNAANSQGPVIGETAVRCLHGQSSPPQYVVYDHYSGRAFQVGPNICLSWIEEKNDYDGATNTLTWRFGTQLFTPDGRMLNNYDDAYDTYAPKLPCRSTGEQIWLLDSKSQTGARYCAVDSYGRPVLSKQSFDSSARDDYAVSPATPIGQNVLLVWEGSWTTLPAPGKGRSEIRYQIRDRSGNLVKSTTTLTPAVADTVNIRDEYQSVDSIVTDNAGKVWFRYDHRYGSSRTFHYVILAADGTVWKGPIETPATRDFRFCDSDGKIWAVENGQCLIRNPDDTEAAPAKTSAWVPTQRVRDCAASVQQDGYRIYDRWANPQMIVYRHADSYLGQTQVYDLNLWATDAHPANLAILRDTTQVWSQSGVFNTTAAVDMSAALPMGQTVLTLTQNDIHGGQVLVTFDYKADYNAPPIIDSPPTASPSPVNGTSTTLSVSAYDPDNKPQALTYTWSVASGGSVTFSASNGTTTGDVCTATFQAAGSYTLRVTVTDGRDSVEATVSVTVNQTLSTIAVTPDPVTMPTGGTQQFAAVAKDQFGNNLATQPAFAWSCAGGGSVDASTGAYSAGSTDANVVVKATAAVGSASASGSAYVTVQSPVLNSIVVSPATATVATDGPQHTQQFAAVAKDQFGRDLSPQPTFTWSATGAGSVDAAGLFTAASTPGTATVTASATVGAVTKEGTASVTVATPPSFTSSPTVTTPQVVAGQNVQFSAASGPGVTLTWDFGDGTPPVTGYTVEHAYSAAGTYTLKVTAFDGVLTTTATMDITVQLACNLWVMKQAVKVGTDGKESWRARYLFNANRTSALIFDPTKDSLAISLGGISPINIPAGTLVGVKPVFTFKSATGHSPVVAVTVNMSAQTIALAAVNETIPDPVPAELRNNVALGRDSYLLDLSFDGKGKFTANSGYRTTAFVVATATVSAKAAGKDSASFSLMLGDPAFQYPGAGGETTVRFRVLNAAGDTVVDKDFTAIVTALSGKFKTGKDTTAPVGKFSYDSLKGKVSVSVKGATLTGLLSAPQEHVSVELTIGTKTYSTSVTLFAPTAGAYSTTLPK